MARSYGTAATLLAVKETAYGEQPSNDWEKFAFISADLSAEQNLINSDLLGQGREPQAPFRDIISDEGNVVVPVDVRNFGRWLQFLLGDPVTNMTPAIGTVTFKDNPQDGDSITLNGFKWNFVTQSFDWSFATNSDDHNQTLINETLEDTLKQLAEDLNKSTNKKIATASYTAKENQLEIILKSTKTKDFSLVASRGIINAPSQTEAGYSHTYTSGSTNLPSFSIEIGHANVPTYFVHTGCMLNSMAFNFQRSGIASSTLNIIARGEKRYDKSQGSAVTSHPYKAFSQFNGSIKRNGVALGNVVAAQFTYSNSLEKIATIRDDAFIEGIDPTIVGVNGTIEVRFADTILLDDAINNTPIELELAYHLPTEGFSLSWLFHEVYLPRPRLPINGPAGVQASFNWQAVLDESIGKSVTVTLKTM